MNAASDYNLMLRQNIQKLEQKILWRNYIEIFVGFIVLIALSFFIFKIQNTISKIGIVISIIACVFIIIKLFTSKIKLEKVDFSLSVHETLSNSLLFLTKEASLLETIFWWYTLPLSIGMLVFFSGFGFDSFFYINATMVLILAFLIQFLNKRALSKEFYPLMALLEKQLEELNE